LQLTVWDSWSIQEWRCTVKGDVSTSVDITAL
jgi:hypothetical protein